VFSLSCFALCVFYVFVFCIQHYYAAILNKLVCVCVCMHVWLLESLPPPGGFASWMGLLYRIPSVSSLSLKAGYASGSPRPPTYSDFNQIWHVGLPLGLVS